MITDSILNIAQYRGISRNIDATIDYILSHNYARDLKEGGRIDEDNYYNVCVFGGKEDYNPSFEAHLKYIDLQYVREGMESFLYALPQGLEECQAYDVAKDIYFLNGDGNTVDLKAGQFVMFFPEDAHKGGKGSETIDKLVFKIKV